MARPHASCRIAQERLEPRVYLSKAIGPKEASPSQWPDGGLGRFDPFAIPSVNDRYLRTADIAECGNRQAVLCPIARRCRYCCPNPVGRRGSPLMKER